jgi:CDP-diglyceride synthetase
MAEEEKTIELPVEPVVVKPSPKRSNAGVIVGIIFAVLLFSVGFYYFFIRERNFIPRRNYNSTPKAPAPAAPVLTSRTISLNSGYGSNFNGSKYVTSG